MTAGAALIPVTSDADNKTDDQLCTLREAVDAANTNTAQQTTNGNDCPAGESGGTDQIGLAAATTYVLEDTIEPLDSNITGDLDIDLGGGPVRINGAGPASSVITNNALATDRLVHGFKTAAGGVSLSLANLMLDQGEIVGPSSGGGNVFTNTNVNLFLFNARVSGGRALSSPGGGILASGDVTLNSVEMDANSGHSEANFGGAGAIHAVGGDVTINDSLIRNNTTTTADDGTLNGQDVWGGAITVFSSGASLSMARSTVENNTLVTANSTRSAQGAGIYLRDADATISDSTIAGNIGSAGTDPRGGGISFNDTTTGGAADNTLTIQNSTFNLNSVNAPNVGTAAGGGLAAEGGVSRLYNVTFQSNGADDGFALSWTAVATQTGGSVTVHGTLFHEDGSRECTKFNGGVITTAGYNVDRANSCDLDSVTGTDLEGVTTPIPFGLSTTLQDNGGPTETHALEATSVARDLIPAAQCTDAALVPAPLLADQRGVERPFGANCDAGAYEFATCASQTIGAGWTIGTTGDDTLTGTAGVDMIVTGAGNDTVTPDAAADVVCTGSGNDTVQLVDSTADTADCGAGVDSFNEDAIDVLSNCETDLSPPPASGGGAAAAAPTENPDCQPLRDKIKRLSKRIKQTDDPDVKAKLKKKRKKARQQLAALGCAP